MGNLGREEVLRKNVTVLKRTSEAMVSWLNIMAATRIECMEGIKDPVVIINQSQRIHRIKASSEVLKKVISDTNRILEIDDAMRRS